MTEIIKILINYIILALLLSHSLFSSVIPDSVLVDWSNAGLKNTLEYQNIYNASVLGLDNSGLTDNSDILNKAIDTIQKPAMILFEPGIYLFNNTIALKNDVMISGYSSEKTFFKFDMNGKAVNCISIYGASTSTFTALISAYTRGSNILISENSDLFDIGDYLELRQENGKWDTNPAPWAKYSIGQIVQIKDIRGDTLFLAEHLRITYSKSLNPQIRKLLPIKNCQIRYLNIERIDEPVTGVGYNISFNIAVNCMISGIESNKSVGSHIMINLSKNISVNGSYFHHSYKYDGQGTKGYGVTINNHSSDCLIENNIFKFLRHSMMVKHGANGNVFACNYSREPNRSEIISDFAGDISLHGHYSFANLFESNIVQNIFIDKYWGPSGPYNTFFRNRAELYGIVNTSDLTDTMNFAGNETTNNQALKGMFSMLGKGHFIYGNNILGKIFADGTDDFNDESIFYKSKPSFWDITAPFPSIGLPYELNKYTIPAKYRYDHLQKKTVGEYHPTSVIPNEDSRVINVVNGNILIQSATNTNIEIYNILGTQIRNSFIKRGSSLSIHLENQGVYFLVIRNSQRERITKILVLR